MFESVAIPLETVQMPWPELCKQCHNPAPFRGTVPYRDRTRMVDVQCPDPFHDVKRESRPTDASLAGWWAARGIGQMDLAAVRVSAGARDIEISATPSALPSPCRRLTRDLSPAGSAFFASLPRQNVGVVDVAGHRAALRRWVMCRVRFVAATAGALAALIIMALR